MVKRSNKKQTVNKPHNGSGLPGARPRKNSNKNNNKIFIHIDNSKKIKKGSRGYRKGGSGGGSIIIHTNSPQQPYPVYVFGENKTPNIANVPLQEKGNILAEKPQSILNSAEKISKPISIAEIPLSQEKAAAKSLYPHPDTHDLEPLSPSHFGGVRVSQQRMGFEPESPAESTPLTLSTKARERRSKEDVEASKTLLRQQIQELGGADHYQNSKNETELKIALNRLKKLQKSCNIY